jgi:hypothetical protein
MEALTLVGHRSGAEQGNPEADIERKVKQCVQNRLEIFDAKEYG